MKSMTGFGRAIYENSNRNYIIDLKTVNNKYSDINVKLPRRISFLEEKIRKAIANKITRGKVFCSQNIRCFYVEKFKNMDEACHYGSFIPGGNFCYLFYKCQCP